jgi:aminoglycoside phosphotransferase (APT) family kinase protein
VTALAPELERELNAFDVGRAALRDGVTAEALTGGLTNRAWRVTSRSGDWVVRVGSARDALLGVDRRAELLALHTAAAHGLAPRCVHAVLERGVLVLEYVAGAVWSRATARSPEGIDRIGRRLRQLHALPAPAGLPLVDPRVLIPRYLAASVGPAGPVPRALLAERAHGALRGYVPRARAFCHHDVHHRNVVERDRLVLLDWEYAGTGDPAMDLAAFASYHDLDDESRTRLLTAYGPDVTRAELDGACGVFDCLQALWHDAAGTWNMLAAESRDALVARVTGIRTTPMDSR